MPAIERTNLNQLTHTHIRYVVFFPQHILLCISYRFHGFQYYRVDVSQNKKMEPGHLIAYCIFMVCFGRLVWMGILLLY